jgi:hypothetical protein
VYARIKESRPDEIKKLNMYAKHLLHKRKDEKVARKQADELKDKEARNKRNQDKMNK